MRNVLTAALTISILLALFGPKTAASATEAAASGKPSNGIALLISLNDAPSAGATFSAGQVISLIVALKNLGTSSVSVAPALENMSLSITTTHGSPVPSYGCNLDDILKEPFSPIIQPGATRTDPIPYPVTCGFFRLPPGTYNITASAKIVPATNQEPYGVTSAAVFASPVSNRVTVTVL